MSVYLPVCLSLSVLHKKIPTENKQPGRKMAGTWKLKILLAPAYHCPRRSELASGAHLDSINIYKSDKWYNSTHSFCLLFNDSFRIVPLSSKLESSCLRFLWQQVALLLWHCAASLSPRSWFLLHLIAFISPLWQASVGFLTLLVSMYCR